MTPSLDRMAVEEVGANPTQLALAIHRQLGQGTGAVPVEDIARALDIQQIRIEDLRNLEGALVTGPERDVGAILVHRSRPARQRFTIAHELGHFLCPYHAPSSATGFWCSRADLGIRAADNQDRHRRQEAEANTFAIELLAPASRTRLFCDGQPDLSRVLEMAERLLISREAAARRYVEHHHEPLALVFSKDGRVRYTVVGQDFPRLLLRKDDPVQELESTAQGHLSQIQSVDAEDWLSEPRRLDLSAQLLRQREGYAVTLLHVTEPDDADDDAVDDLTHRFSRGGHRA